MIPQLLSIAATAFKSRHTLVLENLAIRHQLQVLQRSGKRPQLSRWDRGFWVLLSRLWKDWRGSLVIVQPTTVVGWHKKGFRPYWKWKSRKPGRPKVSRETRDLIRQMSRENPLWGASRIQAELTKLGIDVSEPTVAKYMVRVRKPPPLTWLTFLRNHTDAMTSIDFFTVPTATFRILYVFLVLSHNRRKVLLFNVTKNPSAMWTGRQLIQAFPWDTAPKYLLRDLDSIYGPAFQRAADNLGFEQVVTSPRSP